jgi:hypothetical protein
MWDEQQQHPDVAIAAHVQEYHVAPLPDLQVQRAAQAYPSGKIGET